MLRSWGQSGLVFYMTDLGKMSLALEERQKAQELRNILGSLLSLVIRSPCSFDFEDEAIGVVDHNEGLTDLHRNKNWFSLEKDAVSASVLSSLVQVAHESVLIRERLLVTSQSSPWQNVTVRSSDGIVLD